MQLNFVHKCGVHMKYRFFSILFCFEWRDCVLGFSWRVPCDGLICHAAFQSRKLLVFSFQSRKQIIHNFHICSPGAPSQYLSTCLSSPLFQIDFLAVANRTKTFQTFRPFWENILSLRPKLTLFWMEPQSFVLSLAFFPY